MKKPRANIEKTHRYALWDLLAIGLGVTLDLVESVTRQMLAPLNS